MVIFCFQNIKKNSNAIKSISRSGTTFTATKCDNTTFTFTQQDNNTTYANYKGATTAASGTAGLVPAATTANRLKFLRGDATWQVPTNTTYGAATASALGLVKIGSNITNSSGTISLAKANVTAALGYTPPTTDTNTWRGIQNNVTSTSTTDSLSANMGKWLNEHKNPYVGNVVATKKSANVANQTDTNVQTVTLSVGTYILFMRFSFASNANGRRHAEIAQQNGSSWIQNGHYDLPAVNGFYTTACVTDVFTVTDDTVFAARVWHDSGTTLTVETNISYIKLK